MTELKLFAIFKNGIHKGNERASTEEEAIKNYICSSFLELYLENENFLNQYSAMKAQRGIHF